MRRNMRLTCVLAVAMAWSGLACDSQADTQARRRYVLVHGAWMGAWAWDDVAAGLRAANADVAAVELPAHGADTTGLEGATLDAYVAKVRAAVDAAGGPVILVGHSLGGVVVTATAELAAPSIAKLVYLGAYYRRTARACSISR
jgi:pimeloyl-ACP methyl ester carboxylesterase